MSEEKEGTTKDGNNDEKDAPQKQKKGTDPTLSFKSDQFDPLKALYDPNIPAKTLKVKVYDNLASFEAALNRLGLEQVAKKHPILPDRPKSKNQQSPSKERQFEAHQMPIKSTYKIKKKHTRNLIVNIDSYKGPIEMFRNAMQNQARVTVYTRNEKRIRGQTSGFIVFFDKHYNLILSDVVETWTRRKYYFSEAKANYGDESNQTECDKRLKELGVNMPEIKVKSLNRKYVECTRNVKCLLIRGEQIVLVSVENPGSTSSDVKK